METRREQLERVLASYRQDLADGVTGDLAGAYLREIIKVQTELKLLDETKQGGSTEKPE